MAIFTKDQVLIFNSGRDVIISCYYSPVEDLGFCLTFFLKQCCFKNNIAIPICHSLGQKTWLSTQGYISCLLLFTWSLSPVKCFKLNTFFLHVGETSNSSSCCFHSFNQVHLCILSKLFSKKTFLEYIRI